LRRGDLGEAEWRLLEPLLPPERGRKSRPAFDNRQIVNGILWRIRTGAPWRDLPEAGQLARLLHPTGESSFVELVAFPHGEGAPGFGRKDAPQALFGLF
jgi:hypothetical protein